MIAWTVLATCGPAAIVSLCWFQRICADYVEACRATTRRIPMPDLPDDIGVTPATGTRPAILWARYGNTTEFHAVRGVQPADGEPADREEPQP
ncbi:hypothetical protein [Kitasatospora sp. NPDC056531]|uniref:hypothetical protein n=1 Tax=Kitasatospora sp. NPDC056531 TaxID=3345856 RepID=UPI0036A60FA4